jgi:multiple sugar transport system permease protein
MSQTIPRKYRDAVTISPSRRALIYAVLATGAIAFVLPFYFIVNGSLKTNSQVQAGNLTSLPKNLSDIQWSNYPDALAADRMNFWPALANTVVITTLCVAGQIISCSLVGFGFARFRFRGRSILFMVMLSTMMLPAQVTLIPVFILFRSLGMIDSFWPLVIPAWLASPFFVFMFRQFFSQIPEELVEAARIDGASHWRVYWQLMMPLSGPVIAIVSIYTFLNAWNDFMGPLIYLNSTENRTLTLALNGFKGQYGAMEAHHLMAASVVCMLPCVVLFFAAQKYFVESVSMTGLKG